MEASLASYGGTVGHSFLTHLKNYIQNWWIAVLPRSLPPKNAFPCLGPRGPSARRSSAGRRRAGERGPRKRGRAIWKKTKELGLQFVPMRMELRGRNSGLLMDEGHFKRAELLLEDFLASPMGGE